jgi:hypothetical protein
VVRERRSKGDFFDMTITPELAEVIEVALESKMLDVHTSIPGVIQTYDPVTQTASVELQIQRALENEDGEIVFESLGVLQNVSVVFPRTKKYFMSFPLEPGDTGDVMFSEVPTGQWRAVPGEAVPDSIGRHDLSGAKFYPGLSKDADALTDALTGALVVGEIGGKQIRINATAIQATTGGAPTASDFVAMAAKVDAFISTFDTVMRNVWVPVANDGGTALQTAYLAAFGTAPVSTASTNLKAD